MGATVHWINGYNLERESAALACRRFLSTHTYSRIAELLEEIHTEFGLTADNIVATVTDNASNLAKAFREFNITAVSDAKEEVEELEQELSYLIIDPEEEDTSGCFIILSPQIRCATHTH